MSSTENEKITHINDRRKLQNEGGRKREREKSIYNKPGITMTLGFSAITLEARRPWRGLLNSEEK